MGQLEAAVAEKACEAARLPYLNLRQTKRRTRRTEGHRIKIARAVAFFPSPGAWDSIDHIAGVISHRRCDNHTAGVIITPPVYTAGVDRIDYQSIINRAKGVLQITILTVPCRYKRKTTAGKRQT